MTQTNRKPLLHEEAIFTMQHVNEEHIPELLHCVQAFGRRPQGEELRHAEITQLFDDGVQVEITHQHGKSTLFIPFSTGSTANTSPLHPDDLHDNLHRALRQTVIDAQKKLGISTTTRLAHWTVSARRELTANFHRITFELGKDDRSDWSAGYACRFVLDDTDTNKPATELPSRPYTLRRVTEKYAEVDVFCHQDAQTQVYSAGSTWARELNIGQQVAILGGRQESFPDFSRGHTLLIGDETALPTIAALLETWAYEQPVRIILQVNDPAEQRYLDDVCLPAQSHVSWIPKSSATIGTAESLDHLGTLASVCEAIDLPICAVWGATEGKLALQLRKQFKEQYQLSKEQCRVIGYWRN